MTDISKPNVGDILWGNPLNGAIDQLNALKADQAGLDALKAVVATLAESLYGLIVPQSIIYTFEEGSNNQQLAPGNDVLSVNGIVYYSTAAPAHGLLGLRRDSGHNGSFVYGNFVAASSGSVYCRVTQKISGGDQAIFDFISSTDGSQGGGVYWETTGKFKLVDPTGANQEETVGTWTTNKWTRVDWQQTWDGTTQKLYVKVYINDAEGTAFEQLSASWLSPVPDRIRFIKGLSSNNWGVDIDTYRVKNSVDAWYMAFNPATPDVEVFTFDDGTNGAPLTSGIDTVNFISGEPSFSTTQVAHGTNSVLIPGNAGGGQFGYPTISPASETGSLYLYVTARGSNPGKLVVWADSSGARLASLVMSTGGLLKITDAAATNKATGAASVPLNQWVRVDWMRTWDTTSHDFSLDVKMFTVSEGISGADEFSYLFTSGEAIASTPVNIQFGATNGASIWSYYIDTVRMWGNTDAWPNPYGTPVMPSLPPGNAAWSADATQSTVEISHYTDGTYIDVGIDYSTNSGLSGATSVAAVTPDVEGWNKFHITGLTAGTQYYYSITNTVSSVRSRVGPIRRFKTLKPIGTPCTTKLAIGSCKQDNPANSAAFTDIVSFAPDRTIHLGDWGYPGNLGQDPFYHKYNWSFNLTDPNQMLITDIMCVDYIISDHDVNGGETSAGNAPTYHDPVSYTNLLAWIDVVPARREDTRTPSVLQGDRRRADVEGRVVYLKVDTRSQEKSDTITNPTDPHSLTTTMLGNDQLQWVKNWIDYAKTNNFLVVILTDPAWNGEIVGSRFYTAGFIAVTVSDKWPSYAAERDAISKYAHDQGVNLFVAFGDSHGMQSDDGTGTHTAPGGGSVLNDLYGHASICCGPFCQNLHMHFQDCYQVNYPSGVSDTQGAGPFRTAMQYQQVTITDSGTQITIQAVMRDCTPHKSGGSPPYATGTPKTVGTLTMTYTM